MKAVVGLPDESFWAIVNADETREIGIVPRMSKDDEENARVAALAPEMLDALKAARHYISLVGDGAAIKQTVDALLARADPQ